MSETASSSRRPVSISWWEKLVVAAAAIAILGQHVFLIGYKTYANVDEAYASALASRLLDGQTLYVGAISQRGPMMYYAYEAFARVFGWDNVVALRLITFLVCEGILLATFALTRATLSRRGAAVAACVVGYGFSFGFPAIDGAALNGELIQLPMLLFSYWAGAIAMRTPVRSWTRRELTWLAAAGLSFGIAACVKQSAAAHVVPLLLWIACRQVRARAVKPLPIALVVASAAIVPVLFVVHAASNGSLKNFIYYTITYNAEVHLRPVPDEHPWVGIFLRALSDNRLYLASLLVVSTFAIAALIRRYRRAHTRFWPSFARRFGVNEYLGLHLVAAVASASVLVRFFPHYFVTSLPFVAMAVGHVVAKVTPRIGDTVGKIAAVGASLFLVISGAVTANFLEIADGRTTETPMVKAVGRYVNAITTPEDRIFVWGFSPSIYGYSHRRPAGRYVFSTYVTGFVPWFWDAYRFEAARIVPGSIEALIGDLQRERPKVVVDAGSVMLARSMRAYPQLSTWMHENLCFLVRINAYDVYVRKEGTCPVDAFPKLHVPEDYMGQRLLVAMPKPVDDATSRALPIGFEHAPLWFPEEPRPEHIDVAIDEHIEKNLRKERARSGGVILPGENPGGT